MNMSQPKSIVLKDMYGGLYRKCILITEGSDPRVNIELAKSIFHESQITINDTTPQFFYTVQDNEILLVAGIFNGESTDKCFVLPKIYQKQYQERFKQMAI